MSAAAGIDSARALRQTAPFAGAVVVNLLAGMLLLGGLGGAPATNPSQSMSVELVALPAPVEPAGREIAPPPPIRTPGTRYSARGGATAPSLPLAPPSTDSSDGEVLPIAPVRPERPLALPQGAVAPPCPGREARLRGECDNRWAGLRSAPAEDWRDAGISKQARAYVDESGCSRHLGCGEAPLRTQSGMHKVTSGMGPGGPSGGIAGPARIAPPNPYHVDPGFGD